MLTVLMKRMTKVLSKQVKHLQMMATLKVIKEVLIPDEINNSKIKAIQ
jgi:hypothetical protein